MLVGPTTQSGAPWLDALASRPNVSWVGRQPYSELPRFLAHGDVGVVPYADTAFNRGSFPLKTLEYLSAGLPVVATGLPGTRWLDETGELITIADDPASFAAATLAAAAAPQYATQRARRREFAREHSYERRASDMLAAIDRRLDRSLRPSPAAEAAHATA